MIERESYTLLVEVSREVGVETTWLQECIERRIVPGPGEASRSEMVHAACRVRRLHGLGLNWAGLEIVIPLRQRYELLRNEHARLRREMERWRDQSSPLPHSNPEGGIDGEVIEAKG